MTMGCIAPIETQKQHNLGWQQLQINERYNSLNSAAISNLPDFSS